MRNLTNSDLAELTQKAREEWFFDPHTRKIVLKKSWRKQVFRWLFPKKCSLPVQALYRLSKELWLSTDLNKVHFPFDNMPVAGVFKLANDWNISLDDRKYLDRGPLYACDGYTVIVPNQRYGKWWETGWVQGLFVVGVFLTAIGLFT